MPPSPPPQPAGESPMPVYSAPPAPPLTLSGRLRQLNDSLQDLALRLRDGIAAAVGRAVALAAADGVRALLGVAEETHHAQQDSFGWHGRRTEGALGARQRYDDGPYDDYPPGHDAWEEEDPWQADEPTTRSSHAPAGNAWRWGKAFLAALPTAL